MTPRRPIDIVVQGWCGDAVAVVAVDGEIDADSCAALATAVAQATQTYRSVIIDLTHVRLLSAAGLHCLDCVGQMPDERQGGVQLVCAASSPVRSVLHQAQLHHRWPVHPDLMHAVQQAMRLAADRPQPTGTPATDDTRRHRKPVDGQTGSRVGLPSLSRLT